MSTENEEASPKSPDHRSELPEITPTVLGSADDHLSAVITANSRYRTDSTFLGQSGGPVASPDGTFQITNNSYELRDYVLGDRYELHEEIARGGMGMVLKGRDLDLGRDLAIKVLLEKEQVSPEVMRRFVEEAQIGGQLQHPGIVPVYAVGKFSDNRPFFAMKLVKGQTLGRMLRERASLDTDRTRFVGIFEQVCQTMAYAHSRFVIHRDLKPDNIMVGAFGEVQVMDWGLAKIILPDPDRDELKTKTVSDPTKSIVQTIRSGDSGGSGRISTETNNGRILGTPAYMPPEQALGEIANLDERADVFGLGAILCEILTGKPPYNSGSGTANVRNAVRGNLTDAYSRLDSCGTDLELITIAKSCLAAEQDERPRNAGIVAEAVTRYLHSVEARIVEAEKQRIAAETRVIGERKQRRLLFALAASLLLLVSSVSIGTIMMQKKDARLASEKARQMEKQVADAAIIREQNVRISASNERLVTTQAEAVRQQRLAESLLSDMQASYGLIAARDKESGQAALWFSQASESAKSDKYRYAVNRVRTRNWIAATPQPVDTLKLEFGAEYLRGFSFQPAGHVLLMLQSDNLRLWDLISGQEIDVSWGKVHAACWSPDGSRLFGCDDAGVIRCYSVETWKSEVVTQLPTSAYSMSFSPDGGLLVCLGEEFRIWDLQRQRFVQGDWPPAKPWGIHFSNDSRYFVVSNVDQTASVFTITTSESSTTATSVAGPIPHSYSRRRAMLLDGPRLLSVNPQTEAVTQMLVTGANNAEVISSQGSFPIELSSDGKFLVFAAKANGALYSDAGRSLQRIGNISHYDAEITDAEFSTDGKTVLTVGWDQAARVWNTADATLRTAPIPFTGIVHRCALSSDGAYIAAADRDKSVHIYAMPQTDVSKVLESSFGTEVRYSPSGTFAAPTQWHQDPWMVNSVPALHLMEVASGKTLPAFSLPGVLIDSCVTMDDQFAAALCFGTNQLVVCNITEGKPARPPMKLDGMPLDICASPHKSQISVLSEPGRLFVADPATGAIQWDRMLDAWADSERRWPNLQYSPDGTKLVVLTGGKENRIEVLNSATGEPLFPPIRPVLSEGPCRVIQISPSGRYLATAVNGRNAAQVWDLETGKALCEPLLHPGDMFGIYCVAFSSDETLLFTGSKDRQVRIWDWKAQQTAGPTLEHADEVWCLSVFPNGMQLASAGRDGRVMLWDLPSGKLLAPPLELGESVTSLLMDTTGKTLLATTSDRIIDAPPGRLHRIELERWMDPAAMDEVDERRLAELVAGRVAESDSIRRLDALEWSTRLQTHRERFPKFGILSESDRVRRLCKLQQDAVKTENWPLAAGAFERLQRSISELQTTPVNSLDHIRIYANACLTYHAIGNQEQARIALRQLSNHAGSGQLEKRVSKSELERLERLDISGMSASQRELLLSCMLDRSQYLRALTRLESEKRWAELIELGKAMHSIVENPTSAEFEVPWIQIAYAASAVDDYNTAIEASKHAVEINPERHWAYYNLGICFASLERHDEALASFRMAVNIAPDESEYLENLGDQQLKMLRFEDAVTSFRLAMSVKSTAASEVVNRLMMRSDRLLQYRSYDDAALGYKAALALAPDRSILHAKIRDALTAGSRHVEALEQARLAVEKAPDSPADLQSLALLLVRNGRPAEAETTAREALRISGEDPDAHLVLARTLLALDRFDDAIVSVQSVIANPDQKSDRQKGICKLILARALRAKSRLPEALVAARESAALLPDSMSDHDPMGLLGDILLEGNFDPFSDAERSARRVSAIIFQDLEPEDHQQRIAAAERCYYLQRFGQSADLFTAAVDTAPEEIRAQVRYNSICAGLLALRQQSADGLATSKVDPSVIVARMLSELEFQQSELQSQDPARIYSARQSLKRVLVDEDFSTIRNAALPPEFDEASAGILQKFWADVESLVRGKQTEESEQK